jgi:hypothetical protein
MRPHDCSSCHLSHVTCHCPIPCHYVRYALIRALVYTTDSAEAERIAACALARACLASRRFGGMADPGLLVELLLESVAREQKEVISDRRQVTGEEGDKRKVTSDKNVIPSPFDGAQGRLREESGIGRSTRLGPSICGNLRNPWINPSVFFRVFCGLESFPEACLRIAETLNSMRRFARDLLILHYIEGLSRAELGEVHRVAVGRVRIALAEARLDFIERLAEHEESVCDAHPTRLDVRGVLMQLAEGLNQESARIVGEIVRQYVADLEW